MNKDLNSSRDRTQVVKDKVTSDFIRQILRREEKEKLAVSDNRGTHDRGPLIKLFKTSIELIFFTLMVQ